MKKIVSLFLLCTFIFTSCSKDDDTPNVGDGETLKTYTNIAFSIDRNEGYEAARFFSTELGQSIKKANVNQSNVAKVDLGFSNMSGVMFYFVSPNETETLSGLDVQGATQTIYQQNVPDSIMTENIFNNIKEGKDLDKITVTDDNNSFGSSKIPVFILFKNAAGKKGVIKVSQISVVGSNPRIVTTIKVQK